MGTQDDSDSPDENAETQPEEGGEEAPPAEGGAESGEGEEKAPAPEEPPPDANSGSNLLKDLNLA